MYLLARVALSNELSWYYALKSFYIDTTMHALSPKPIDSSEPSDIPITPIHQFDACTMKHSTEFSHNWSNTHQLIEIELVTRNKMMCLVLTPYCRRNFNRCVFYNVFWHLFTLRTISHDSQGQCGVIAPLSTILLYP